VIDEFAQLSFGRTREYLDVCANVAGIVQGFWQFLVLNEVRHDFFCGRH